MKDQELKKLKKENEELKKGWQRTQADFINFQKRTEEEKEDRILSAKGNLFCDFLDIIDHLERSNNHLPSNLENDQWARGIKNIYQEVINFLSANKVKKIETKKGDDFDINSHEAILSEKNPQFREGEIIEILQTGYEYNGKTLRPTKVKVAIK